MSLVARHRGYPVKIENVASSFDSWLCEEGINEEVSATVVARTRRRKAMTKRSKNTATLDWSQCPAVESTLGKRNGAWVFKGTRTPVFTVFENLEDMTVNELV